MKGTLLRVVVCSLDCIFLKCLAINNTNGEIVNLLTDEKASGYIQLDAPMRNITRYATFTVRIRCEITGSPLPSYNWYKDGVKLDSDDRSGFTYSQLSWSDETGEENEKDYDIYSGYQSNVRDKSITMRRIRSETMPWGSRLTIKRITEKDAGLYKCVGYNENGQYEDESFLNVEKNRKGWNFYNERKTVDDALTDSNKLYINVDDRMNDAGKEELSLNSNHDIFFRQNGLMKNEIWKIKLDNNDKIPIFSRKKHGYGKELMKNHIGISEENTKGENFPRRETKPGSRIEERKFVVIGVSCFALSGLVISLLFLAWYTTGTRKNYIQKRSVQNRNVQMDTGRFSTRKRAHTKKYSTLFHETNFPRKEPEDLTVQNYYKCRSIANKKPVGDKNGRKANIHDKGLNNLYNPSKYGRNQLNHVQENSDWREGQGRYSEINKKELKQLAKNKSTRYNLYPHRSPNY